MRHRIFKVSILFVAGLLAPLTVVAQADSRAGLKLQDVKERLEQNAKFLEQARNRGKAGDAPGLNTALENYTRGTQGLDRALAAGKFDGDVWDREEAFERVEKATRKHGDILSELRTKVPEQALPAIERALSVSQHGRETAMQNLQQARGARQAAERQGARRPDSSGRPGTINSPAGGSAARRPSGVGGPGAAGGRTSGAGRPPGRP